MHRGGCVLLSVSGALLIVEHKEKNAAAEHQCDRKRPPGHEYQDLFPGGNGFHVQDSLVLGWLSMTEQVGALWGQAPRSGRLNLSMAACSVLSC